MIYKMHIQYSLGMIMELRHLRYLIAVAEERHITRAAERLGMQQPPLSRQIKAIEHEIGVQLFRRIPRGVELTDAGRAFLGGARSMFATLDHTIESTRRTARGEQGRISVGYTSGAALHPLVSQTIRGFRETFPLVSVTLAEGYSSDLIQRMRNDQIDIAFIRTQVADPEGVVVDLLQEEATVLALHRGHALARRKNGGDAAVSLKALANETFIAFGSGSGAVTTQTSALVAACEAAGFTPRISHVVSNNLSRLNLVAAGLGISVVSTSVQRINIEGRRLSKTQGCCSN
jgi:DNA-binding transcriptional LysR family regulator